MLKNLFGRKSLIVKIMTKIMENLFLTKRELFNFNNEF